MSAAGGFVFTGLPGELDTTRCTMCGRPAGEHHKSVVVFRTQHGGVELRTQCDHLPVTDFTHAIAVVSSTECLMEFLRGWARSLNVKAQSCTFLHNSRIRERRRPWSERKKAA